MKNVRINTDQRFNLSLKAGGKSIDMTGIDVLSLYMYCNPQKARDGAIKHSVSTSDAKVLEMIWPADVQRYLGSHSVHGTIRYAGAVASFDIPAVNVVSLTSEADISTDTIMLEAPVGTEDLTATITIQGIGPQGPQGPKGDKMTYADLTQEEKDDLYEGVSEVMKPLLATKQNVLTDTDGSYGQRVAELETRKANLQHQHTVADITDFPELYYDATAFFTSGAYPSDKYEELLEAVKAKRPVYATVDETGHISYVFFMSSANSDGSSSRVLLPPIFADGSYLYLNTFVLQQSGMTPLQESITGKADKATTLAGYGIGDAYTKSEVDTLLEEKQETLTAGNGISIEGGVIGVTKEISSKQDAITDLETIRSNATNGNEAAEAVRQMNTDLIYKHRTIAEAIVSVEARLAALESSRGLLGEATAGRLDVTELTTYLYPRVLYGHGVPSASVVPDNLPAGLPWDGVPVFIGQQYINLDATSAGLYYAKGHDSVSDWKQA